jgi:hypothetical protein
MRFNTAFGLFLAGTAIVLPKLEKKGCPRQAALTSVKMA